MEGSFKNTRAIETRCFSPPLNCNEDKVHCFRYVSKVMQVTTFPHLEDCMRLSHLQTSFSYHCVILVREIHDCVMDSSMTRSIINLYGNKP
jgi:hypothetical protein